METLGQFQELQGYSDSSLRTTHIITNHHPVGDSSQIRSNKIVGYPTQPLRSLDLTYNIQQYSAFSSII